jgi:hypothetical protein
LVGAVAAAVSTIYHVILFTTIKIYDSVLGVIHGNCGSQMFFINKRLKMYIQENRVGITIL